MKFTILGASGFIGRHLAVFLQKAGHDVHTPGKAVTDLFDRPLGHVLYCIGLTADFRSRPFDTMRAHVTVLTDILEKAAFDSLVYLSSTRVYAHSQVGVESAELAVNVSDRSDLYNISKLAGESLCRSCGRTGVKVARISNVIGHDPDSTNFLCVLIREAVSGHIDLQSHPASSKDYILMDDVLSLLPKISTDGQEWIYNVASGVNLRHDTLTTRLSELTGCRVNIRPDAPTHHFPLTDISRIRAEFGFSPSSVLDRLPQLVKACQQWQNRPV